tara:strand:- start:15 stop:2165 length:2151 start_codon:yes stop_codon:yes gene_type:complete
MEQRLLANRYQVSRELARGGMGVVYDAIDRATGRRVAVKVMLGGLAGVGDAAERFVREAQACARLDHPRVVPVLDAGTDRGNAYLVMGFLEGDTLQNRIRLEQRLQSRNAVEIAIDLAKVLEYIHGQGILHRDLKPENVILTAHGPVLTDFGIAFDGKSEQERLTQSGTMLGTPGYMPPEQVDGEKDRIDARADVYALGATLFAMLSGTPPFSGTSVVNLLRSVLMEAPPKLPSLAPVEPALDAIVQRCLEKEPEDRYADARALREALEGYLSSTGPGPKNNAPLIGAILVLALAILGAALLVTGRSSDPRPSPSATQELARASQTPSPSVDPSPARGPSPVMSPLDDFLEPAKTRSPRADAGPDFAALRRKLAQRNWVELKQDLTRLTKEWPRSAELRELWGETSLREYFYRGGRDRLREAGRQLDLALELDPKRVRGLALRVKVRLRLEQDYAADARLAARLGQGRDAMAKVAEADRLMLEGRADPRLKDVNLAREVVLLQEAIELEPSCWWAVTDLVGRFTNQGQYLKAEEVVVAGLLVLPNDPYLYFRRAMNFKMHGELAKSADSLRQALEAFARAGQLEPTFSAILLERGYAHFLHTLMTTQDQQVHSAAAIRDLEAAVEADPTSAHAAMVLGMAYAAYGRFAAAHLAYQACVNTDPEHFLGWAKIAQLRAEHLGDLPGARAAIAKAIEHCSPQDPSYPALVDFKEQLDAR